MHLTASATIAADREVAFDEVADLSGYPDWLSIVLSAAATEPHPEDPGKAWMVGLGARVGPLQRSKQVRMVRTLCESPTHVRFERMEHDGQAHSEWVLDATVAERAGQEGCAVVVSIDYSGASLPFVEIVLRQEAGRAGRRLAARVERMSDK